MRRLQRREARSAVAAVLLAALFGTLLPAHAAELVMFDLKGCPWCQLWKKEIGPVYGNTDQGKRAPLRIVDYKGPRPPDLGFIADVTAAPTFVLVDGGKEVGRITGYTASFFFWEMLDGILAKLPPPEQRASECLEAAQRVLPAGGHC